MKIINPCSELKTVNMYLKAMVSELKLKSPNSQVTPSKGRTTKEAFTPALSFTSRSLSSAPAPFTLTVTQIIRMNTTTFICVENSLWISRFQQTRSLTPGNSGAFYHIARPGGGVLVFPRARPHDYTMIIPYHALP